MISQIIISNERFVLIVDDVGLERFSAKFISRWLQEQGQNSFEIVEDFLGFGVKNTSELASQINSSRSEKRNIILPPLAHLLCSHNAAGVFQFVNALRKESATKQLFLWATSKNVTEHFVVPFLEYMADMTVHLIDSNHLTITTRKSGGLVSRKNFMYELTSDSFSVQHLKEGLPKIEMPVVKPETLGTFKIDLNEEELVARNALKLPYEKTSESSLGGRVIYTPDIDDDLDDEDPDEDLYI